jgi:hypothetical protein
MHGCGAGLQSESEKFDNEIAERKGHKWCVWAAKR